MGLRNPDFEVVGAKLELETIEDYEPGYSIDELEIAFSAFYSARTQLEQGIRRDVASDKAHSDSATIVSEPHYYVNGKPVGNRTYLSVSGLEPKYVHPYKLARWRTYKTLLDKSIAESDFVGLMDFATTDDDPYFAEHIYRDLTKEKKKPGNYAFTPQATIDKREDKKSSENLQIEAIRTAIAGHNQRAANGELNVPEPANEALSTLMEPHSWLTSRGYRKYLYAVFLVPLSQVVDRPIIEKQILDKEKASLDSL
jgi:hypothetical protein